MVFRGVMLDFGACQGEQGVASMFCGDVGGALGRGRQA